MKNKFYKVIRMKYRDGYAKIYYLFSLPFLKIVYRKNNNQIIIPFFKNKNSFKNNNELFYLKVNLNTDYCIRCLQLWINVVELAGYRYVIVCDDRKLRDRILASIYFSDDVEFIKSKNSIVKRLAKMIVTKRWYNAGCAHLTTFFHAAQNNIKSFWNIDADDTVLCLPFEKSVQLVQEVMQKCKDDDIDIMSLDMWTSRTRGKYWTFGVCYVNNNMNILPLLKNPNIDWKEEYSNNDRGINLDWYLTYLRDYKKIKARCFYIENGYFLHWSWDGIISKIISSFLCYWEQGNVIFPIIVDIYKNDEFGIIPININLIKFELGVTKSDCINFMLKYVTQINSLPEVHKRLWWLHSV